MVIGVAGKKRSGKDTFFNIISETLGTRCNVKRYAFADEVKAYAENYFKIPKDKVKEEENRIYLQGIGQMFREKVNRNYWVNFLMIKMMESRLKDPNELSIITDVRYINEVEKILELENSLILKVENPNIESYDSHISENDLNEYHFDYIIKNDSTMDVYEKRVREWIELALPWMNL